MVEVIASIASSTATAYKRGAINDDGAPFAKKRRTVVKWDWERARKCVHDDYLGLSPLFNDRQFERFFRVSSTVAEELCLIAGNLDEFFTERIDAVKRTRTICPKVKILCGLKQVAYGVSPSAFLDYFQMGETTARDCMKRLCRCICTSDVSVMQL